ncbi:hypothetical protein [Candidatus Pyrohabitans sp.]
MALKLLHPSCFVTVIHHPILGTILECSPRTVTKLNCPKKRNQGNLTLECFAQCLGKVEHAVPERRCDYVSESRSGRD